MGPVTIAVDSYGPVTDNAQSVFELSVIETIPRDREGDRARLSLQADFRARQGAAGGRTTAARATTFKATAKPVLIGTGGRRRRRR